MKRFFLVALILCLLPICAFAGSVEDFNAFAVVLGAEKLDAPTAKTASGYSQFTQDGCTIGFDESAGTLETIFIDGEGTAFLAYCCAAIRYFDRDGDVVMNNGNLLNAYLLAKNAESYTYGQTANGYIFFISYDNGVYSFAITKS